MQIIIDNLNTSTINFDAIHAALCNLNGLKTYMSIDNEKTSTYSLLVEANKVIIYTENDVDENAVRAIFA